MRVMPTSPISRACAPPAAATSLDGFRRLLQAQH
jgi:hypothetical protein